MAEQTSIPFPPDPAPTSAPPELAQAEVVSLPKLDAIVSPVSLEAVQNFMAENEEPRLLAKQMNVGAADIADALHQVIEKSEAHGGNAHED